MCFHSRQWIPTNAVQPRTVISLKHRLFCNYYFFGNSTVQFSHVNFIGDSIMSQYPKDSAMLVGKTFDRIKARGLAD